MGSKERKYLIDNNFDDLCLNKYKVQFHKDNRGYLYVSDILEAHLKAAQKNGEAPETIDNNGKGEICQSCDGRGYGGKSGLGSGGLCIKCDGTGKLSPIS